MREMEAVNCPGCGMGAVSCSRFVLPLPLFFILLGAPLFCLVPWGSAISSFEKATGEGHGFADTS